jgi:threonine 3-dehydrogenase
VFASDQSAFRRDLAAQIGADTVYGAEITDLPAAVIPNTRSKCGVDVLLEMSGNPRGIIQGLKSVRPGGDAVLLGLPKQEILCDIANDIVAKGITLHGIIGRTLFATWQEALNLLETETHRRAFGLRRTITHVLPITEFQRGFELMQSAKCGKVILCIDDAALSTAKEECQALGMSPAA